MDPLSGRTIAVLPDVGPNFGDRGLIRELIEPRLPEWLEARWWSNVEELHALAPEAEIGWFDMHHKPPVIEAVGMARGLKWLNSLFAGLDFLPLEDLQRRGVLLTNGSGLTALQVSEFALLGMLAFARNYRAVVRAQDRHEWLQVAPGIRELEGSRVLLLGYGEIGRRIERHLHGFGAEVVPVRRSGAGGALGPDEWRARLGEFDWIVLVVPGTAETEGMIGAAELAAMKREAVVVNFARGNVVDQEALADAAERGRIAGAVLDVADPEPLPAGHRLWSLENVHITMHLSGRPTPASLQRAADRFLANCERYRLGQPLEAAINPSLGY